MLVGSSVRRWIAAPLAAALLAICSAEAVGLAAAQSPALEASAQEQQFLELLNAFRADPVSQQKALRERMGQPDLDLSDGGRLPLRQRPPLALNSRLIRAARSHSHAMVEHSFFAHNDQSGRNPGARLREAGYHWRGYAEALAAGPATARAALDLLIVDEGVPDYGHRTALLGMTEQTAPLDEVGIGIRRGGRYGNYYTVDLGTDGKGIPALVGVAYRDGNGNGMYDPEEGVSGVEIEAVGTEGRVVTGASGGYSLRVDLPGNYVVVFRGGGLPAPRQLPARVGRSNVKLDLVLPAPPQ